MRMGLPQLSVDEDANARDAYASWLLKHPSALENFREMIGVANGKKIVVFLDYDGTLSDIVPNPNQAFMTNEMRTAVTDVARCFPTAIITGRSVDKVYGFVRINDIYYAGSHGLDIVPPFEYRDAGDPKYQNRVVDKNGDGDERYQPAKAYIPLICELLGVLNEKTRDIKGATIEDNKFCASVHFRNVANKDFPALEGLVKSVLQDFPELRLSMGNKVFEIRPDIEWDKGHALRYLIEKPLGYGDPSDVFPIYIGDDRTDEDAFRAIRDRGQGFPIVVSSAPKDSIALYSLKAPAEVKELLLRLVVWKETIDREVKL